MTLQGKLVVLAAALVVAALLGIAYAGSESGGSPRVPATPAQTAVLPAGGQAPPMTLVPAAVATITPAISQTPLPSPTLAAAAAQAATATSVPPSPTSPPNTPTPSPPTPVPPAPTATPPPPPPTATPTPAPAGCVVDASLAPSTPPGSDTVSARLVCDGVPIGGAPLTAVFYYQAAASSSCVAAADGTGLAGCNSRAAPATVGALEYVNVCFGHLARLYCVTLGRAPGP